MFDVVMPLFTRYINQTHFQIPFLSHILTIISFRSKSCIVLTYLFSQALKGVVPFPTFNRFTTGTLFIKKLLNTINYIPIHFENRTVLYISHRFISVSFFHKKIICFLVFFSQAPLRISSSLLLQRLTSTALFNKTCTVKPIFTRSTLGIFHKYRFKKVKRMINCNMNKKE